MLNEKSRLETHVQEIMAYFDHRYTNAATEALNGLIKIASRMGRGYSFKAIRAKVLLTGGLRRDPRPRYSAHHCAHLLKRWRVDLAACVPLPQDFQWREELQRLWLVRLRNGWCGYPSKEALDGEPCQAGEYDFDWRGDGPPSK